MPFISISQFQLIVVAGISALQDASRQANVSAREAFGWSRSLQCSSDLCDWERGADGWGKHERLQSMPEAQRDEAKRK